jgi:HK97 family phage portal protein
MDGGQRFYSIGDSDVTGNLLHIRYQGSVDDAHGHGPLEAGQYRMVAAQTLARYGASLAANGGIPSSILKHPETLAPEQSALLQQQWIEARMNTLGMPAVLSGGIEWEATQMNPTDMALLDLEQFHESRIALLLGVPPFLVGLPSGGDSMTYSNVNSVFDFHWRAHLRPRAQIVMDALSGWLLPRQTRVELNRDSYVQPEPLQRAQTAQILNSIVDADGNPALSVEEIRASERFTNSVPSDIASGVLK